MRFHRGAFAVLLAVILTIWLWPSIFGGKVMLPADLLWQCPPHTPPAGVEGVNNFLIGDMLYENYVWKVFQQQSLERGQLPLWNPFSFCGHPLYATGQASTFYPLNAIFLIIPVPYAYVVFTWLHLLLGGLFQFIFLRRLGAHPIGAAIGGVVFALCGFFAMRLIWPMLLGSAIWLPLMLLCIMWMAQSRHLSELLPRLAGSAIVFAMPMLSGFFEIAFYAYFTAGIFTLFCAARRWYDTSSPKPAIRLCVGALAMVMLAVLLTGPQLLPFREVTSRNTRVGEADYDRMVNRALRAEHLLPLIVPDIYGNPGKHTTFDLTNRQFKPIEARHGWDAYHFGSKNYSENGYYIGLLPLALAVLSIGHRGMGRSFFFTMLVISMLMAFGTAIYALFFYGVPGFDQVRTPFRWMFPATFAVSGLAASGATFWVRRLQQSAPDESDANTTAPKASSTPSCFGWWISLFIIATPVLLLLALGVLLVWPSPALQAAEWAMNEIPLLTTGFAFLNAADLAGFMWANALRFALFAGAALALTTLPWLSAGKRVSVTWAGLGCILFAAADVGLANAAFTTHADPAWLKRTPPAIEYLQQDKDVFRIGRFGSHCVLHPNLPLLYGLQDVGGYDSIILGDYARFLDAIEPQKRLWWNQITSFDDAGALDSPLWPLLNIRYLISHPDIKLDHPDWEQVHESSARIYRSKSSAPRAFLVHHLQPSVSLGDAIERMQSGRIDLAKTAVVEAAPNSTNANLNAPHDPQHEVRIVEYSASEVRLHTSSTQPAALVLCDMMYPGWQVEVDDEQADILRVNGIFRGVKLPRGDHEVRFFFKPASLQRGSLLAATAVLLIIAFLLVPKLPVFNTDKDTHSTTP